MLTYLMKIYSKIKACGKEKRQKKQKTMLQISLMSGSIKRIK